MLNCPPVGEGGLVETARWIHFYYLCRKMLDCPETGAPNLAIEALVLGLGQVTTVYRSFGINQIGGEPM